jgi:hypothetical protein
MSDNDQSLHDAFVNFTKEIEEQHAQLSDFEQEFYTAVDQIVGELMAEKIAAARTSLTIMPAVLVQSANLLKEQCSKFKQAHNQNEGVIYLPKHRAVVTFNEWASSAQAVAPAYLTRDDVRQNMALFVQTYMEHVTTMQDTAKSTKDTAAVDKCAQILSLLKSAQEKMSFPKGREAKQNIKPVLFPPMKKFRMQ